MKPCSQCGYTVSIEDLQTEIQALEDRKAGTAPDDALGPGAVPAYNGEKWVPYLPDLVAKSKSTTCAKCGYTWVPDAANIAAVLVEKIRALKAEVGGAVEVIGDLTRPEP